MRVTELRNQDTDLEISCSSLSQSKLKRSLTDLILAKVVLDRTIFWPVGLAAVYDFKHRARFLTSLNFDFNVIIRNDFVVLELESLH